MPYLPHFLTHRGRGDRQADKASILGCPSVFMATEALEVSAEGLPNTEKEMRPKTLSITETPPPPWDGECCPKCRCLKLYQFTCRPIWRCANQKCRYEWGSLTGTVFKYHKKHLQLYVKSRKLWNAKRREAHIQYSINKFSREIGVSYKTANSWVKKFQIEE